MGALLRIAAGDEKCPGSAPKAPLTSRELRRISPLAAVKRKIYEKMERALNFTNISTVPASDLVTVEI